MTRLSPATSTSGGNVVSITDIGGNNVVCGNNSTSSS